jgi:hypothetical protein
MAGSTSSVAAVTEGAVCLRIDWVGSRHAHEVSVAQYAQLRDRHVPQQRCGLDGMGVRRR